MRHIGFALPAACLLTPSVVTAEGFLGRKAAKLEFGETAESEIRCVPIKLGTCAVRSRTLEDKGLVGRFVVK